MTPDERTVERLATVLADASMATVKKESDNYGQLFARELLARGVLCPEVRSPKKGEWYLSSDGWPREATRDHTEDARFAILLPLPPKPRIRQGVDFVGWGRRQCGGVGMFQGSITPTREDDFCWPVNILNGQVVEVEGEVDCG